MSPESKDVVKRRAEYDEFHGRDPLQLWAAIKETHGVNNVYQDDDMIRMDLRAKLNACRHGDNESITDFYERYRHRVECLNDVLEDQLNEVDTALDFYQRLNHQFDEFKAQFTNMRNNEQVEMPETLGDMYNLVLRYVPTVKSTKSVSSTVFTTNEEDFEDREDSYKPKRQLRSRSEKTSGRERDAKKDSNSKESSSKELSEIQCFQCKGYGHYKSQCPTKEVVNVKWTYADEREKLRMGQVLLDNQADRSIFLPELLVNMKPADALVKGITQGIIQCAVHWLSASEGF